MLLFNIYQITPLQFIAREEDEPSSSSLSYARQRNSLNGDSVKKKKSLKAKSGSTKVQTVDVLAQYNEGHELNDIFLKVHEVSW